MDTLRLAPERVFAPDRFALGLRMRGTDRASDLTLAGSFFFPFFSIFTIKSVEDRNVGLMMLLESQLCSQGLTRLCKGLFHRPRPYAYDTSLPLEYRTKKDAFRSFFSGHATAAFDNAMVAGCLFDAFHPHSTQRKWIWAGGFTLAASTGILRVLSGNHFPTDVVAGAVVGCLTGYLIHRFHKPLP